MIDTIKVSAVKGPDTDDHCCVLDSGANVMVIPWKDDMKGDPTMCALVGNNQAEGLIASRLTTQKQDTLNSGGSRSKSFASHLVSHQDCKI